MLIIFIFLAILIITSLVLYIENKRYYGNDCIKTTAVIFIVFAIVALITASIFIITRQACAPSEKAQLEAEYEVLTILYKNDTFNNDNDAIGNSELYMRILEYNKQVAVGKTSQNSLWLNWFTPHIYDELELININ